MDGWMQQWLQQWGRRRGKLKREMSGLPRGEEIVWKSVYETKSFPNCSNRTDLEEKKRNECLMTSTKNKLQRYGEKRVTRQQSLKKAH